MHISMGTHKYLKLTGNVSIYVCLSTNTCTMSIHLVELSYLENLKAAHILKIFSADSNTEDTITSYISRYYKIVYTIRGKIALPQPYTSVSLYCTQVHRIVHDSSGQLTSTYGLYRLCHRNNPV